LIVRAASSALPDMPPSQPLLPKRVLLRRHVIESAALLVERESEHQLVVRTPASVPTSGIRRAGSGWPGWLLHQLLKHRDVVVDDHHVCSNLVNARRPDEENRTASQPVPGISASCAAGGVTVCHCVANRCNGPLHVVAPADPVAEALERARSARLSSRDGRRLRRDLLALLADLEED